MTVHVERHSTPNQPDKFMLVSDYEYDFQSLTGGWHKLDQLVDIDPNLMIHLTNCNPDLGTLMSMAGDITRLHYVMRQAMIPIYISDKKIKMVKAEDVMNNVLTLEQIFAWQVEAEAEEKAKKEKEGAKCVESSDSNDEVGEGHQSAGGEREGADAG